METYYKNNPNKYGMRVTLIDSKSSALPSYSISSLDKAIKSIHENRTCDDTGSVFIDICDSVGLEKFIRGEENTKTHQNASTENGESFCGTKDMDESLDILRNGDEEILASIRKDVKETVDANSSLVEAPFGVKRSTEGMFFDVGLYLSGEPEAFYQQADELVKDKVVIFNVLAGYKSGTNEKDVRDNIVKILSAVNILEMSGYSVGVTYHWTAMTDSDYNNLFSRYAVKSPRQSLNLRRLIGAAHPGFFRRIVFRLQELGKADSFGYGVEVQYRHDVGDMFQLEDIPENVEEIINKVTSEKK